MGINRALISICSISILYDWSQLSLSFPTVLIRLPPDTIHFGRALRSYFVSGGTISPFVSLHPLECSVKTRAFANEFDGLANRFKQAREAQTKNGWLFPLPPKYTCMITWPTLPQRPGSSPNAPPSFAPRPSPYEDRFPRALSKLLSNAAAGVSRYS
jgi:hypothetical protein